MSYSFLADMTSSDMSPSNEAAIFPTHHNNSFNFSVPEQVENDECFMNAFLDFPNDSYLLSTMNAEASSQDDRSEKDVPVDVVDSYTTTNLEHAPTSYRSQCIQ
jgi:hypothetical protein